MTVRKLGPTENQLHVSVAEYLDWSLLPPAFFTTFPAGWGQLSGWMAQHLKRCHMKAGMPDILVFYNSYCFGIELKAGRNTVSPEQRETFNKLHLAGIRVHVCRSIEDVQLVLLKEHCPVRRLRGVGDGTRESA